jgi:hypothetical protein
MMLRAPETEALDEGSAQKGFGFSILDLDGSSVPLCSTATGEPIEIPKSTAAHETTGIWISLWRRWKSPDATGLKTLWIKAQKSKTKEYQ